MESYSAPFSMPDGELAHVAITNDITEIKIQDQIKEGISEIRKEFIEHKEDSSYLFGRILYQLQKVTLSNFSLISSFS